MGAPSISAASENFPLRLAGRALPHSLPTMSVIYIPTELKSYITKMVVLDYLWTTLHSDAPV